MGQTQTSDFYLARRRPEKALRSHGRYIGNLGVFGEAGAAAARCNVVDSEQAAPNYIWWPKSTLALSIAGAAVTGTVLGAMLWMPFTSRAVTSKPIRTEQAYTLAKKQTVAPPTVSAIADQPSEKEHANELRQLNGQIASLQNEVAALSDETLDLNSELFQLELHLQGLEDQSTEKRVIYNFVNVPIGKTTDSAPIPVPKPIPIVDLAVSSVTDSFRNDPKPDVFSSQEIAYDDQNGFHLNSQFAGDTDEPVSSDDHWKIVYPPIGSE